MDISRFVRGHDSRFPDPRAARVARYFSELLQQTRGIRLATGGSPATRPAYTISFKIGALEGTSSKVSSNPESYAIDISPRGVELSASDSRGLFYAAVTFWQLCTAREGQGASVEIPAMRIVDSPRFAWRGLLLDSARNA